MLNILDLGCADYKATWDLQKKIVEDVVLGQSSETLILVEHPHVITRGLKYHSAPKPNTDVPVIDIERGGGPTYHGPGQLVGYPIIHLTGRGLKIADYIRTLEGLLIETLFQFGIKGERAKGFTGVWVKPRLRSWIAGFDSKGRDNSMQNFSTVPQWVRSQNFASNCPRPFEPRSNATNCGAWANKKIVSIGVAVRRWVTYHGFALNVNTDLNYFKAINPCGLEPQTMTSMESVLGYQVSMSEIKKTLMQIFERTLDSLSRETVSSS